LDLRQSIPTLRVPVAFFLGRYDRHADANLAANYYQALTAPAKRLVWFEHSAHNIPFEEPALFDATVLSTIHALSSVYPHSAVELGQDFGAARQRPLAGRSQ
jgi:pimeloyl-ACP methyl ester carboxylesterase